MVTKQPKQSEPTYTAANMLQHLATIKQGESNTEAAYAAIEGYLQNQLEAQKRRFAFESENNLTPCNHAAWRSLDVAKVLRDVYSRLCELGTLRAAAERDQSDAQLAIMDIMHEIEFLELDVHEKLKRFDDLRDLRHIRRKAKNFLNETQEVDKLFVDNKAPIRLLVNVGNAVRDAQRNQETLQYTPRRRAFMQDRFDQQYTDRVAKKEMKQ